MKTATIEEFTVLGNTVWKVRLEPPPQIGFEYHLESTYATVEAAVRCAQEWFKPDSAPLEPIVAVDSDGCCRGCAHCNPGYGKREDALHKAQQRLEGARLNLGAILKTL